MNNTATHQTRCLVTAVALSLGMHAHADIVGVDLTLVDFSGGYVFADGTIHEASAHLVPDARPPGTDTWRLWARVDDPDAIVTFVGPYSLPYIPLYFNLDPSQCESSVAFHSPFGTDIDAPSVECFETYPELAYDSWLTIGHDGGPSTTGTTQVVDTEGWLADWSVGRPFAARNGFLFDFSQRPGEDVVPGGPSGWRMLIGQITVPKSTLIKMHVQVGGDGSTTYAMLGDFAFYDGICCNLDGTCERVDGLGHPGRCEALGGYYIPESCCEDVTCPEVFGACCTDVSPFCSIQSPEACEVAGGVYLGDGAYCRCAEDCAPNWHIDWGFGDRMVNVDDLIMTIDNLGTDHPRCDSAPLNPGSTPGNGVINIDDVLSVINAFGACYSTCP